MKISYSRQFIKQSKKLDPKMRQKLLERIILFNENPLHKELRNHPLKGKFRVYRSIDITGDYRALYLQNNNEIIFDMVGTHSQLYG
jgi:mRNA interferase YafQ